ncbi:MAG: N-acetylmuramoyl-L-alanine amidase, partial [Leptospiraceae bacterium]|nr:N-acetylmuramoyl-L-alanine amidase [Leptospiraceae bacterium]
QNFRYSVNQNQLRMVWDLSQNVEPKLHYDSNQKFLNIQFEKAYFKNSLPILKENPFVFSFTVLSLENEKVEFVFHLKKEVQVKNFSLKNNHVKSGRYVLDLQDNSYLEPGIPKRTISSLKKKKYLIVLDAGHGGKDPGAIGTYGTYEKNISFLIVRRLAKALQKHPNFEVFLTREEDYYLDLNTRLTKANEKNADLFLSIHVNSSQNPLASGSSTFVLSEKCALEEARKFFQIQNTDTELAYGYGNKNLLSSVVLNFQLENLLNKSNRAAELIAQNLAQVTKSNKLVRDSEFFVLRSLKAPSVLIEVDFISNPERELLLNTAKYQKKIAKAIYKGILEFYGL